MTYAQQHGERPSGCFTPWLSPMHSCLCAEGSRAPCTCVGGHHCLVQACAEGQHLNCCTCCISRIPYPLSLLSYRVTCIPVPVSVRHGSVGCRRELHGGAGSRHGGRCAAGLEPAPVLQLQPPGPAGQPGCSGMGVPEHGPPAGGAERHQLHVSALPACNLALQSSAAIRHCGSAACVRGRHW